MTTATGVHYISQCIYHSMNDLAMHVDARTMWYYELSDRGSCETSVRNLSMVFYTAEKMRVFGARWYYSSVVR